MKDRPFTFTGTVRSVDPSTNNSDSLIVTIDRNRGDGGTVQAIISKDLPEKEALTIGKTVTIDGIVDQNFKGYRVFVKKII